MISVIVPVYNVYEYLDECIESICNQTYKDLEIILVDDGSTDKSGSLCDYYSQRDARIRVIHQENQGLSEARNKGVLKAKGEYIIFIDSDDRIHSMMIQALYDAVELNRAELAICSHRIIQESEEKESLYRDLKGGPCNIEVLSGRECVQKIYSEQSLDMVVAWNKIYKKSMFDELRYPADRLHEDEFITYKILYPLKRCVYLKIPLYEYRMRNGSITQNKNICCINDRADALEERFMYFEQKNDKELYWKALCKYQTYIAEIILDLEEIHCAKNIIEGYQNKFHTVYQSRIISSKIALKHKSKYKLFMINRKLYKFLKNLDDKRNKNHYDKKSKNTFI